MKILWPASHPLQLPRPQMRWMEGGLHWVSQGPQADSAIGGSELWADSQALPGALWSEGADSLTIN